MKRSNCNRKSETRSTSTAVTSLRSQKRVGLGSPFLLAIFVSFLVLNSCNKVEGKPGQDFGFSSFSWNDKSSTERDTHRFGFDDDDNERMDLIVQIIVGIVVFVMVAIFAFILCLCCPICILAKIRSRRRGVVYRSATTTANGTTVTTQQNRAGTTITIGTPRAQTTPLQATPTAMMPTPNQQMIAISNNAHQQNKPYPVQQSVTVVPVVPVMPQNQAPYPYQPQAQGYSHQTPYPSQMPQPQNQAKDQYNEQYNPSELPPPYPGLSREMDSNNLPYNPYFSDAPPASAPSMKQ